MGRDRAGIIVMWTETNFNVTRREASTSRPFGEVVATIEARAPVVRDRLDALVTKDIKADDLRKQIENHLGASGFALFMKVEHDVIMSRLGRTHRSVQYAIGKPLIAKDVSDAAYDAAELPVAVEILVASAHQGRRPLGAERFRLRNPVAKSR
jgi:hypothetical protein